LLIGVLGFVVVMVGIIWLPISIFTKKGFKNPVFLIATGFILLIVGVSTTGSSSEVPKAEGTEQGDEEKNEDETDDYKTNPGEIENSRLLINLEVGSETVIQDTEMIDGIKSVETTARKLHNQIDDETGEIYENVYQVNGVYAWENKRYEYVAVYSFDVNNVNETGNILIYNSDLGNNIINKSLTTEE